MTDKLITNNSNEEKQITSIDSNSNNEEGVEYPLTLSPELREKMLYDVYKAEQELTTISLISNQIIEEWDVGYQVGPTLQVALSRLYRVRKFLLGEKYDDELEIYIN